MPCVLHGLERKDKELWQGEKSKKVALLENVDLAATSNRFANVCRGKIKASQTIMFRRGVQSSVALVSIVYIVKGNGDRTQI